MIAMLSYLLGVAAAAPAGPEAALRAAGAEVGAPGAPEDGVRFTFPEAFGTVWLAPADAAVEPLWEGASRTLAARWPPTAVPAPGDAALGDGLGVLLVREGRVVVYLRAVDPAAAVAAGPAGAGPTLADRAAAILAGLRAPPSTPPAGP